MDTLGKITIGVFSFLAVFSLVFWVLKVQAKKKGEHAAALLKAYRDAFLGLTTTTSSISRHEADNSTLKTQIGLVVPNQDFIALGAKITAVSAAIISLLGILEGLRRQAAPILQRLAEIAEEKRREEAARRRRREEEESARRRRNSSSGGGFGGGSSGGGFSGGGGRSSGGGASGGW